MELTDRDDAEMEDSQNYSPGRGFPKGWGSVRIPRTALAQSLAPSLTSFDRRISSWPFRTSLHWKHPGIYEVGYRDIQGREQTSGFFGIRAFAQVGELQWEFGVPPGTYVQFRLHEL